MENSFNAIRMLKITCSINTTAEHTSMKLFLKTKFPPFFWATSIGWKFLQNQTQHQNKQYRVILPSSAAKNRHPFPSGFKWTLLIVLFRSVRFQVDFTDCVRICGALGRKRKVMHPIRKEHKNAPENVFFFPEVWH